MKDREILLEIHGRVADLYEVLSATLKANEQECSTAVLCFYKYVQAASTQNFPGARQVMNEVSDMVNKKRKPLGGKKKK